jgi:hypothetical protein
MILSHAATLYLLFTIGIYPFVEAVQAKRNSENRPKETWEWKPINVDYEFYLDFVLNKVILDIKDKWPRDHCPVEANF